MHIKQFHKYIALYETFQYHSISIFYRWSKIYII